MKGKNINPFADRTPENMDADTIAALFEDVYVDVPLVIQRGHTFINGPRGSGKSMMLQYLLPEVQKAAMLQASNSFSRENLENYCFYFGIRSSSIKDLPHIDLSDDGYTTLAHHFLSVNLARVILVSFKASIGTEIISELDFSKSKFYEKFISLCEGYGISLTDRGSSSQIDHLIEIVDKEIMAFQAFARRLTLLNQENQFLPYHLGVTTFLDFIYPLLETATQFSPNHFFIMIDDTDELNDRMQKVVNTWISYRTNKILSLKISTQMRYGSYKTIAGSIIESPHDFNVVDLSQIYTSRLTAYFSRVKRIIEKRLEYYDVNQSSEDYFPSDAVQEAAIEQEKEDIKKDYISGKKKVSSRMQDDIYRYAIPNYMVSLAKRKKSNLFSYSGFKTLVNISSGVVRFFLEPASQMYNKQLQKNAESGLEVRYIEPQIQNEVSRTWASEFARSEIDELVKLHHEPQDQVEALKNLVAALGDLFTKKLLDETASERRVFSIFTPPLPKNIEGIIQLGVSHGYFQRSMIRSKEATGIKDEIILSRRLAPHFYLDPTGYTGRLSVDTNDLQLALRDPKAFVNVRLNKGKKTSYNENVEPLFSGLVSEEEDESNG